MIARRALGEKALNLLHGSHCAAIESKDWSKRPTEKVDRVDPAGKQNDKVDYNRERDRS